ncbi:hypothetical protein VTI28DRAFT_5132 [Corynascus sepedonium]
MQTQPPKYVSPPTTWRTKLGLRVASMVFLVILCGLGGSLATDSRVDGDTLMIVVLAPAAIVTFIWDVAESICIWKRGGHRGIHPGAIVAIDLIAWLGWAFVDLLLVPYTIVLSSGYYVDQTYGGNSYRYGEPEVSPEYEALLSEIQGKTHAIAAFAVMTTAAHFALFVIACYETHIRNHMPSTVYVFQPVYGAAPGQIPPGAYQQLGPLPPQPVHVQPFPNQSFTPPTGDTKNAQGAERFA